MFSFLDKIFRHDVYRSIPVDDILARQRYILFRLYSFTGIILFCIFSFEEYSLEKVHDGRIFIYGSVLLTLLINYIGLQFHRQTGVAYTISIISGLILIHCATYYSGGIRNPDFMYLGTIILYAYIVMENRGGKITLFLSLLNIVYFFLVTEYTAPNTFISFDNSPRDIDTRHLYTAITSMFLITALSSYLEYSKNAVIKRIEESNETLSIRNEELKELSLVASETVNSVIIINDEGEIEWVNDGFTRLTGYKSEEVMGRKPGGLFYGPGSDPATINLLETRDFPGHNLSTEIIKYRKDGTSMWVQDNVTRITDENNLTKYIFIETDISERKKSEEKIAEYLRSLEKTNKELDKFAYVVSHDLKAPLRAIGNLTGWIEEDAGTMLPGEVRQNFNLIKERVIRMEALINGILDYSKAAKSSNQYEMLDLNDLVSETIDLLGPGQDCKITVQGKLPEIFTDRVKAQQIFLNLIGNAIKFNDKSLKEIHLNYTESKDYYQFSLTDNGPGIDPRFHDKVFVIFQTVNPRDEFESTGVGLAIVKKIVEEEGGKIWIESMPDKGTTFHFTWPRLNIKTGMEYTVQSTDK